MSFQTGQDRTPKFAGQVLPDRKVRSPGRKTSGFRTVWILKICWTSGLDVHGWCMLLSRNNPSISLSQFSNTGTYALSFYWSKMILDRLNNFGVVPIILDWSNSVWSGPNHFRQVQVMKVQESPIWTWPKWFVPNQNFWHPSKKI